MGMPALGCCFAAVFLVSAVIHLIGCFCGRPKTSYTKPLLVSSLALFCLFYPPKLLPVLLAALAASWLGDVLLMPKGNRWFVAGGISFLISHVLFIFVYLPLIRWQNAHPAPIAAAAAAYLCVSAAVIASIRKDAPKPMLAPLFLYLAANSTMNVFAFSMLVGSPSPGAAAAFAGALCFFVSDCVLFLSRYHAKKDRIPKRGFLIMLTYILGEALIAVGVMTMEMIFP